MESIYANLLKVKVSYDSKHVHVTLIYEFGLG